MFNSLTFVLKIVFDHQTDMHVNGNVRFISIFLGFYALFASFTVDSSPNVRFHFFQVLISVDVNLS